MLSRFRERQPNVFNVGCICHLADLCASSGVKKLSLPVDEFLFDVHFHFDRRYTGDYPDSLTCRPDLGRRSALIGHIFRYGRHQAAIGSISGQIGHICRYGRRRQHIGTNRPYSPIWPTSAEDRHYSARRSEHICHICRYGRHQADIGSILRQSGHICRYVQQQADVGRRSALIGQKIGTYQPYMPIWLTSGRRRPKFGTYLP